MAVLNRLGLLKQKMLSGEGFTIDDFRDPTAFGAGAASVRDRYQQASLRGGAPLTAKGLAQAFGNAMGVTSAFGALNPMAAGMRAGVAAATGQPVGQAALGVQDIEGQFGIDPKKRASINDVHSYLSALHAAEAEAEAKKAAALQKAIDGARKQASARSSSAHGSGGGRRSDASSKAAASGPAGRGSGQMRSGMA